MQFGALNRVTGGSLVLGLALCSGVYAQPVASPATLATPVNTATTLDLAPFITGTGITGIAVASAPSHGTANVSGTSVTFAPASNFFGGDSFTYVAFGAGGTSAPATVTVTITGRPDPAASPGTTGLLAAQFDGARRYATTQISNFQRRLESLHRRPSGQHTYAESGRPAPSWRVAEAPAWPMLAGSDSINLAALAGSASSPGAPGAPNFWIDGVLNFGTREPGADRSGSTFRTTGISFGVDRRWSDNLVLGIGGGLARDKTDIGLDGTRNRTQAYSIAAYASYQAGDSLFVDGLLGVGSLDMDSQRYVAPVNAFASGNRDGRQIFGSLMAAYEYRDGGVLVSPYARLDYFSERLNPSAETGAGQQSLVYFGQTAGAAQGALGVRAESIRPLSFGWAVPHVRAEYRYAFQDDRIATVAYADQPGGPLFGVPVRSFDRNVLVLGLGNDIVLRNGLLLGVDFLVSDPFSKDTNQSIRFRLAKDLDARGPSALGGTTIAQSPRLNLQVDAGYQYDDNVTRSRTPGEILSDHSYSINITKAQVEPISENMRVLMTYFAGAETFQNYNGLSRLLGGIRGELQYRGSGEWNAATLSAFGRFTGEQYESTIRNGYRYTLGVSARQPVTDRIEVFGALAHNERHGSHSSVFTGRDASARISVDYSLSRTETLYLTGEYRRGDIVSTGSASLDNLSIAKVLVPDDAYPGRQFFSYRIDADTVLLTLGYNIGFGPRDSLDLSWRRAEAKPFERWAHSTAPSTYVVNQYSLVYLMRF